MKDKDLVRGNWYKFTSGSFDFLIEFSHFEDGVIIASRFVETKNCKALQNKGRFTENLHTFYHASPEEVNLYLPAHDRISESGIVNNYSIH